MHTQTLNRLLADLERDGIAVFPEFLSKEQLLGMRTAFESRLQCMRCNTSDGYEKTERHRRMVQDVLALDQGFVDAALHPVVKDVLREYVGDSYELVEAKGWQSLPTRRDFHGWHGDAWYDQSTVKQIPREVKLGIYLSDVNSGFFQYIKGSHRKQHPRYVRNEELRNVPPSDVIDVRGRAGSGFLFDTSGVHRQSVPVLEPRYAVFFNYHDPRVPLQSEDIEGYRYHPLILNAAFLGGLSEDDRRIFGFGNKQNYNRNFVRDSPYSGIQKAFQRVVDARLLFDNLTERVRARLTRLRRRPHIKGDNPGPPDGNCRQSSSAVPRSG
jgi:hypothetical protein